MSHMQTASRDPDRPIEVGDPAEILCHDGRVFTGIVNALEDDYMLLNGCGFPYEDIVRVSFSDA